MALRQPDGRGAADPGRARPCPTSAPRQTRRPRSATTSSARACRRDDAYGAFQRGYFLTALAARPAARREWRRRGADPDREIYANGLGVAAEPRDRLELVRAREQERRRARDLRAGDALPGRPRRAAGPRARRRAVQPRPPTWAACRPSTISALLHVEGRYVEPSLTKAAALMKEAADAGLPEAQYDYGMMLIEGAGIAPDPVGGAEQMRLAAEAGPAQRPDRLRDAALSRPRRDRATAKPPRAGTGAPPTPAIPVAQNRSPSCSPSAKGCRSTSRKPRCGGRWRAARASAIRCSTSCWSRSRPTTWRAAEERARFWPSEPPATVADAATGPDIRIVDTRTPTQSP